MYPDDTTILVKAGQLRHIPAFCFYYFLAYYLKYFIRVQKVQIEANWRNGRRFILRDVTGHAEHFSTLNKVFLFD